MKADPNYPISDWKYQVANDDTLRGYFDWVAANREADGCTCDDGGSAGCPAHDPAVTTK